MPGLRCEGGSGVDVGPRVCRDAKAVGYANDTTRHLTKPGGALHAAGVGFGAAVAPTAPAPGLCLAVAGLFREFQDGGGERLWGFLRDQVPDSLQSH